MTYTDTELLDYLAGCQGGHLEWNVIDSQWLFTRPPGHEHQGRDLRDILTAALDAHRRAEITYKDRLLWLLKHLHPSSLSYCIHETAAMESPQDYMDAIDEEIIKENNA